MRKLETFFLLAMALLWGAFAMGCDAAVGVETTGGAAGSANTTGTGATAGTVTSTSHIEWSPASCASAAKASVPK